MHGSDPPERRRGCGAGAATFVHTSPSSVRPPRPIGEWTNVRGGAAVSGATGPCGDGRSRPRPRRRRRPPERAGAGGTPRSRPACARTRHGDPGVSDAGVLRPARSRAQAPGVEVEGAPDAARERHGERTEVLRQPVPVAGVARADEDHVGPHLVDLRQDASRVAPPPVAGLPAGHVDGWVDTLHHGDGGLRGLSGRRQEVHAVAAPGREMQKPHEEVGAVGVVGERAVE